MVRNRILSVGAITAALAVALGLGGCGPSPLYVQTDQHRGTAGDVPRDGTGEPMFNDIATPQPIPPAPYVPAAPGIPVTGPGAAALDAAAPPPPGPAFTLVQRTPKEIRQDERRKRRACRHLRSCN